MLAINNVVVVEEELQEKDENIKKIVDNIRALGIDMINEAKSGHPGIVLGAAPIITTLYKNHMKVEQP